MYEKINYTFVGLFVTIFTALALYFAFWLAKGDMHGRDYNYYIAYFSESVDGLNKDSVVKLNGVDVGRIESIAIDSKREYQVEVKLLINKNIQISRDMNATLVSQGLTGLRYINIVGGKSKSYLAPNSENSIIPTQPSLLSEVGQQTPKLLESMKKLINQQNLDNLQKILNNSAIATQKAIGIEEKIDRVFGEGNRSSQFNLDSVAASIKDLNRSFVTTFDEYKKLAKDAKATLGVINTKLPKLVKSVDRTSSLIHKTIVRGDYNFKRIFTPAVREFRTLSISIKELGDELQTLVKDPTGTLINGKSPPKGPGE